MATDSARLVDVRARTTDADGTAVDKVGSGTLIADDLVLTAAHVVFDGDAPLPVRLHFNGRSHNDDVDGVVIWPGRPGAVDAALVRITSAAWKAPVTGRLRFGRFTGRAPRQAVDASGFPRSTYDGHRVSFQLSGHINPQGALDQGCYLLSVAEAPSEGTSPWGGASGAGVFSGGWLVGALVADQPGFAHDLLKVTSVAEVVADPGAAAIMGDA